MKYLIEDMRVYSHKNDIRFLQKHGSDVVCEAAAFFNLANMNLSKMDYNILDWYVWPYKNGTGKYMTSER